ncbi:hypothetical protein BN1723_009156, partial [Verticillium longisporum]
SAARSAARRERLESGQPLPPGYDDDSGISGIGLTPVDELDPSYSSPETASSGGHSASGGSNGYAPHHHQHNHQHFAMQPMPGSYYGHHQQQQNHHGYTSSVSSNGSGAAYSGSGHTGHSQSPSPYMHPHGQRLPSVDMGIDAIINRPGGVQQL